MCRSHESVVDGVVSAAVGVAEASPEEGSARLRLCRRIADCCVCHDGSLTYDRDDSSECDG